MLEEINSKYRKWHEANMTLEGPLGESSDQDADTIEKRTEMLRDYKAFLDQKQFAEQFDSRSNLHSSVIEEFLYYLFRDLVRSFGNRALIGKSRAFKDLFFVPPSYEEMLQRPYSQIERKDHDFVIGAKVEAIFRPDTPGGEDWEERDSKTSDEVEVQAPEDYESVGVSHEGAETQVFDVPAIAIECKTYLDKTMLEGSSRAAEEIKGRNPNGLYFVLCERLKLSEAVNLRKYAVDQIYILRQERNIDREDRLEPSYMGNPIGTAVVERLFNDVRAALTEEWSAGIDQGIERGWLL